MPILHNLVRMARSANKYPFANLTTAFSSPRSPGLHDGLSLAPLDIANDQELINIHRSLRSGDEEDGPSAADYDPTADMREDELRDERRNGHVGPHGEILDPVQKAEIPPVHGEQSPEKSMADDNDDFDMFAEDFDEDRFVAPRTAHLDTTGDDRKDPAALAQPNGGGILEGDDKDGYYKIRIGEIMNGRYQVQSTLGKGMFSGVARAVDITNKKLVAIKMMRNNDALRKGGFTEIAILQKINDADPENRKHIVKFERHFEHKGHLCLAFENLSLNLREVLRKFGNNIGINLGATRAYAHQIFVALAHLRKCSIIHADLKPDNILVGTRTNCSSSFMANSVCRSTKPATCSSSATWVQLLIDPTLQLHILRSLLTLLADSIARPRSSSGCHTIMPLICGPLAALYTNYTPEKSCLRVTVITRCSRPSWRSVASSAPNSINVANCRICISMKLETLLVPNKTKHLERYVSGISCLFLSLNMSYSKCFLINLPPPG